MAKIPRYDGNLKAFASEQLGNERTLFGELTFADDLTSQVTADFLRGWGIVSPSDSPSLQDFNAIGYTATQLSAYLHQMGVAEYNAEQEYYIGSIAQDGGALYISLVNANAGNDPISSPDQWRPFLSGTKASQEQAESGVDNDSYSTPLRVFQALRSAAASATEALRGVLRVGTQAEVNGGVLDDAIVTPKKLRLGFAASFGTSANYVAFPQWLGSWAIQWGSSTVLTTQTARVNFPIAFNEKPALILTGDTSGGTRVTIGQNNNLSESGFDWTNIGTLEKGVTTMGASVPAVCIFLAIGKVS